MPPSRTSRRCHSCGGQWRPARSGAAVRRRYTRSCIEWRSSQLHRNAFGSTLGATTLLHEPISVSQHATPGFPDRARFFAYTARAMRGLIIDHVRERRALKRGGEFHLTALNTEIARVGVGAGRAWDRSMTREGAGAHRRAARGTGGPEVFLRLFVQRHRSDARRVRAHRPARLEQGAPVPAAHAAGRLTHRNGRNQRNRMARTEPAARRVTRSAGRRTRAQRLAQIRRADDAALRGAA